MLQFVLYQFYQELCPETPLAVLCPGLKPQIVKAHGAVGVGPEEATGKAGLDEMMGRNSWL